MDRMTLHEAQTKVANIFRREGLGDPEIDWSNPLGGALSAHVECLSAHPLTRKSIAWREIRSALLAYKAHLDFIAGCAFADAAAARHLQSIANDCAVSGCGYDAYAAKELVKAGNAIRDGLHYAEAHQ